MRYALTAEAAAEQLAPYARFSRVEAYVDELQELPELEPVPKGGNVVLIEPADEGVLDGVQGVRGLRLVSAPQLYVDLYRRGGAAREAADFFRKQGDLWRTTPAMNLEP